jgi:hypothetical protein
MGKVVRHVTVRHYWIVSAGETDKGGLHVSRH